MRSVDCERNFLKVSPVNSIVSLVDFRCPRLIVNNTLVGTDLGITYSDPPLQDYFYRGDCDEAFEYLAEKIGWKDELNLL